MHNHSTVPSSLQGPGQDQWYLVLGPQHRERYLPRSASDPRCCFVNLHLTFRTDTAAQPLLESVCLTLASNNRCDIWTSKWSLFLQITSIPLSEYLYPAEYELFTVDAVDARRVFSFSSGHWLFDWMEWWLMVFDGRRLDVRDSAPLSSSVAIELIREIGGPSVVRN